MKDIRAFQADHLNHVGKPLLVDGDLGPQTQWALAIDDLPRARRLIIERALSLIGVAEEPLGSNRGSQIDFWLERCGIKVPSDPKVPAPQNAWCAAFASWCLSAAGTPIAKARVADLVKLFPVIPLEAALPGDLGYFLRDDDRDGEFDDSGHVWILTGREGDLTMQIEGNTNHAVRVTTRPRALYVRTAPLVALPGIPPKPLILAASNSTH